MRKWVDDGVISIDTLYGIGLLNEPHICGYQSLWLLSEACLGDYYPKGYNVVRQYFKAEEAAVVIDVAGLPLQSFNDRFPSDIYSNMVIDAHHYQCFSNPWAEIAGGQSCNKDSSNIGARLLIQDPRLCSNLHGIV